MDMNMAIKIIFSLLILCSCGLMTRASNKPKDCASLRATGQTRNGEYTVWVNGVTPTVVFCDMVTDGGGWTVFQRRQDAATNFDRLWADYKRGFGNKSSSFWLGLDMMHAMTTNSTSLRIDLTIASGSKYYSKHEKFIVGSEAMNYYLQVSGYSGNCGDSFSSCGNLPFSTRDRDNDYYAGLSCADYAKGGWWYYRCYYASLNGLYSATGTSDQYIKWYYNLAGQPIIFTEMKFRDNATVAPPSTASEACKKYKVLSDDSRFYSYINTNKTRCDNNLNGWYRFMYNAGNRMLDTCPSLKRGSLFQCGAEYQGWLNGTHPEEDEKEVNRTVCFSRYNNCTCDYPKAIKVRNCGQYYVYLLNGVPKCNQRYCGARDKRAIVSCADNYIRVELDTKYFNASKYGSITLRDKTCTASFTKDYITLGSIPNGCGATMTETAHEIIFENEVIINAKVTGNDMITRDHDQSIDIRCVYKRSGFVGVSFDPIMKYSGFEEGIGSFTFNFGMYESEAFARRYSSYPVKVNTRDRLFFQASAIVQDSSLTLLIDQCYSTPNMNRFYHKKYMIIDNGCPADNTVQFHRGYRQNHRFSMDAFRYLGNSTTVYIHCLLFLCHKSSTVGKCRSGCPGNNLNRVKRDVTQQSSTDDSNNSKFYLLEVGPVTLKKSKGPKTTDGKRGIDVKFIVLIVGIAALAVVVVVLVMKRRKRRVQAVKTVNDIGLDNAAVGEAFVVGEEGCNKNV